MNKKENKYLKNISDQYIKYIQEIIIPNQNHQIYNFFILVEEGFTKRQ